MNLVAVCFVAVTEGYIIFDSWELRCIIAYGINNLAVDICDLHNDYSLTQICCVFVVYVYTVAIYSVVVVVL